MPDPLLPPLEDQTESPLVPPPLDASAGTDAPVVASRRGRPPAAQAQPVRRATVIHTVHARIAGRPVTFHAGKIVDTAGYSFDELAKLGIELRELRELR